MNKILFISIILNYLLANDFCIKHDNSRDINRQEYIVPEQIQSENFVIHFTVADNDFQEINGQLYSLQSNYGYAQSIIDLAEMFGDWVFIKQRRGERFKSSSRRL